MNPIDGRDLDPQFKYDVAARPGGENLKLCFACGTCTAGCPVSEVDAEFNPRKIIRQIMLGMREEVLASPVIWRCAQCYSCTAKCPQNVRFREVMCALRELAVAEGQIRTNQRPERFRLARDVKKWIAVDIDFHQSLLEASGLKPLVAFGDLLQIFFQRFRESVKKAEWEASIDSHVKIVDILRKGDIPQATAELRQHIESHKGRI